MITRRRSQRGHASRFGLREIAVWYGSSRAVVPDFQTIGKKLKILGILPNPFPFYDWIMGFHERRSNRAAVEGLALHAARRVLEVGVGTGHLLSLVVRRLPAGASVTAADLSRQMLRNSADYLARQSLLSPQIRFERCDCTRLPYPDGVFDLYASSYLFDLLGTRELALAIREMERVLAPGGRAVLVTMTTELEGLSRTARLWCRLMNGLYCLGYEGGRWNPIWRFLFAGYSPHCRPVALGWRLRQSGSLVIEASRLSRVAAFPVRIYHVRKSDA